MKTAIANFKNYLERRSPDRSTTKHYLSDLSIFSRFVGNKSPREITVKMIDDFVQQQVTQQLKPTTINRRLSTISSFFNFVLDEAEDDTWPNPVRWKRHSVRLGHHLPQDVSDETAETILAVINDPRDQAIFTLMLKAGLRVGEVVGLNLSYLEPPGPSNLARLRVCGKGNKERIAWLTLETWSQLQPWLEIRPQSEEEALFLNQHGRRLSVSGVQYRLGQYRQQAGLDLTCHQLRHTFARRLAEHDMPLDSLAKLLGHTSLKTTQLYIDGADPTVRRDFEQAMQSLSSGPTSIEPSAEQQPLPSGNTPTATPDERPNPVTILDNLAYLTDSLPAWLAPHLRQHTLRRMANWSAHRLKKQTYGHLYSLGRICQWLVEQRHWTALEQLQRSDLAAYVDHRLAAGLKPGSIRAELVIFGGFWRDLLDQELVTNGAILRVKAPQAGEHLPQYLTPVEFERLLQLIQTETLSDRPQDRFNQAWFYLLAHAGLRASELLNLRLSDCDLTGQRLRVRAGKGNRDRVIPMTDTLTTVVRSYLAVREIVPADHLLIHRATPVNYSLISARLQRFGQKANIVPLNPHRLRHTLATLLVNQGMPITSLQKFLGHQNINMTLIYAKVFDETVRQQFAAAMAQIEGIAVADWPMQFNPSIENLSISTPQICDSV